MRGVRLRNLVQRAEGRSYLARLVRYPTFLGGRAVLTRRLLPAVRNTRLPSPWPRIHASGKTHWSGRIAPPEPLTLFATSGANQGSAARRELPRDVLEKIVKSWVEPWAAFKRDHTFPSFLKQMARQAAAQPLDASDEKREWLLQRCT
eukprot:82262-Rhodomonas_salina.4